MAELELSPGERDGRGGIVGEVAELVLQTGDRAGRAEIVGW